LSTAAEWPDKSVGVIVVGAGPTGLALAIDLGRRGVTCVLVERLAAPNRWPKFDRCNARTMESFRRWEIADRVRDLGYPEDNPMDVFILRTMAEPPLVHLRYPSVAECRDRIQQCKDGSLPLEPYQLVSQNRTEPLLKEIAESLPTVSVRYGCELVDFTSEDDGVAAVVVDAEGRRSVLRGQYLVGTDGARSSVRKKLGIALEGTSTPQLRQVVFHSEDLYDRIPVGKGRHYSFVDANRSTIVAQGDRREFTLHSSLPEDADFEQAIRDLLGFDVALDIRHVSSWTARLLLADSYGQGRVFLAGDAVHQVIPTGGLGMNSGVGDALNLSWKLAGVLSGWGGPTLLQSYERERRPVAARNREASGWAAQGVAMWRELVSSGAPLDEKFQEAAAGFHARQHGMIGAEFGFSYAGSPVIVSETSGPVEWEISSYTPSARPGDRLPHMWLSDGRAVQDLLGDGYTLIDLRGDADLASVVAAFDVSGTPLDVVRLDEESLRAVYECSVLLVRPDLHVVWRGDLVPPAADALIRTATGNEPAALDDVNRPTSAANR
jgi:2-polyprenyl-6-methoxyphenol hydroxylase-like FAD-dependent oxidoreductase